MQWASYKWCLLSRHMPDQAVVDMNDKTQDALERAVAAAVQSISKLAMHLDMLVLQIGWYHT